VTNLWRSLLHLVRSPGKPRPRALKGSVREVSPRRVSLAVVPDFDGPEGGEAYSPPVRRRPITLDRMPAMVESATAEIEALQTDFARQLDRFTGVITLEDHDEDDGSGGAR
jgi:hypothetical protein